VPSIFQYRLFWGNLRETTARILTLPHRPVLGVPSRGWVTHHFTERESPIIFAAGAAGVLAPAVFQHCDDCHNNCGCCADCRGYQHCYIHQIHPLSWTASTLRFVALV